MKYHIQKQHLAQPPVAKQPPYTAAARQKSTRNTPDWPRCLCTHTTPVVYNAQRNSHKVSRIIMTNSYINKTRNNIHKLTNKVFYHNVKSNTKSLSNTSKNMNCLKLTWSLLFVLAATQASARSCTCCCRSIYVQSQSRLCPKPGQFSPIKIPAIQIVVRFLNRICPLVQHPVNM